MSLADILRKEGALQAQLEVAQRLLAYGKPPSYVAKMTNLPLKQVHQMAANQSCVQIPLCDAAD